MRTFSTTCFIVMGFALLASSSEVQRKGLEEDLPERVGLLSSYLKNIDDAVEASVEAGEVPGAVVLVARHGQIGYLKAFGCRSLQPKTEPMTVDTIFDVASLTKVVATTPSIMLLVDQGVLRLEDKVQRYLPTFSGGGKDNITLHQLLTHYSGLPADFDLSKSWRGYPAAMDQLWKVRVESEPGKKFIYSDLNFIALGEIVRAVSGKMLDVFAQENVFVPLGMVETFFLPPASLALRIAPTEPRKNTLRYLGGLKSIGVSDGILRGEVHDPTAWRMGGVAGHAGLFSSARDLAVYAQMLVNHGVYQGCRILSSAAVEAMTTRESPHESLQVRGFGWDIESTYSSPRGDLFRGGYGHTGFTGTSLWIHPPSSTFVIILSNRVHPDGKGEINHLRAVVANIVAAAVSDER